jgi:hypothetical protein
MSAIVVADVISLVDAWIEGRLSGDATIIAEAPGGVWNEEAEQGTTGRIVRYAYLSGGSARQTGAFGNYELINNEIVHEVLIYLVTMVAENNRFEDLAAGATRIKQLLHRAPSTANIVCCRYLAPHKERVPHEGLFYPELGGLYEITVQP